jgi:hypothetical protein
MLAGPLRALALGALAAAPAWAAARFLPSGGLHGHALEALRVAVGGLVYVAVALPLARPLGVDEARLLVDRALGPLLRR